MDPNQYRQIKSGADDAAVESAQAGWFMAGGVVLLLGGVGLILQAHASVADVAGGMLVLIGGALLAGSLWLYSQRA